MPRLAPYVRPCGLFAAAGGGVDDSAYEVESDEALRRRTGLVKGFLDRTNTSWASYRDMTRHSFQARFNELADAGHVLVDVDFYKVAGRLRISGVWQKNHDRRGWYAYTRLSHRAFSDKWRSLRDRGYVLIDQESYLDGRRRYYAGIWVKNKERVRWASFRNLTARSFSAKLAQYRRAGYLPIDVEAYTYGSGTRYSMIWVQNKDRLRWSLRTNMSRSTYARYFTRYKNSGYRVFDVEGYKLGRNERYAAIYVDNHNDRRWAAYRDMTPGAYANRWKRMSDAGYRVVDFDAYRYGNGTRFAAVWRQSSSRPNYEHRLEVDEIMNSAKDEFDIPGMSVVVMQNGALKYARGVGHQDVASDKAAFSGTVYRLASISKAVGGVFGVDLEERGLIDLERDADRYIDDLPEHHTYEVGHTLTNRSGIGHYSENGSPGSFTHFDTAREAMEFFEDNALEFDPGTDYVYSTHAYTAFGAAVEGALGTSLTTALDRHLFDRYDLRTLRVEDRTVRNRHRSTLYTWDSGDDRNEARTPDDLSWKILGGGLEASAIDLARFGNKLLAGDILGNRGLNKLWTAPDDESSYAYGWSTGTDECAAVVAKSGAQLGARTYMRIYPDQGIVVVVMTNRKNGGHSPSTIGKAIGTQLLTTECD